MELKPGYLCPPGYKQTEVGLIPEEWNPTSLKGKIGIAHGFAFASEHFASHGKYRLTTPGHFYEAGGFRDIGEKQKYYDGPVPCDYVLRPGDLIVAMTEQADGLLGSAAVIPKVHGYLHNQRLGRVKSLSSEIELDYLFYIFNSPSYRAKVRETAAGTKVKHTSPGKLLEISVRLPPIPEQRAIAGVLSDVDELIGALDQLIGKKRDLKQATMQQLLTGKTRLPGFSGKWEVKRFADVAFPRRDRVDPRSTGVHEFCVELEHIESASGVLLGSTSTGDQSSLKSVFRTGDVLFGKLRAYLRKYWLATCSGVCSTEIWVFVPYDRLITTDYLFQLVKTDLFIEAASNAYGTHMPRSDWNVVKNYELQLPPLPEQSAIAEVLSDMDAELAALEQRRDKTRALKQGMMQELLTGRTRLV